MWVVYGCVMMHQETRRNKREKKANSGPSSALACFPRSSKRRRSSEPLGGKEGRTRRPRHERTEPNGSIR